MFLDKAAPQMDYDEDSEEGLSLRIRLVQWRGVSGWRGVLHVGARGLVPHGSICQRGSGATGEMVHRMRNASSRDVSKNGDIVGDILFAKSAAFAEQSACYAYV